MEEVNHYLFNYCERAGNSSIWAEPINTLTNAAFLIAAWFAFSYFRQQKIHIKRGWDSLALVMLLALIGVGSSLFHMFATHATMLMDVIPITLFINLYLVCFVVRILEKKISVAIAVWAVFQAVNMCFVMFVPERALNGSVMYAPAYGMLWVFVGVMALKRHVETKAMAAATLVFTGSLLMRTFDHELCEATGFGVHFGWHILNGVLLYLLLRMLIRATAKKV